MKGKALLGQVKAKFAIFIFYIFSKSLEARAFYRSTKKSKEVLFTHSPHAGHMRADNRGSQ